MLKNITLTADAALIETARERARAEHRSLNVVFREWLKRYARADTTADDYGALMRRLRHVAPGRRFSRDEMNER
jgi:hypothetical protein